MADTIRPDATDPAAHDLFRGESETASLMRRIDWAATSLGPVGQWPQSLKTAVRIMLTSRQPIWVGWGPELIYLYNDAYRSIIGGKHPHMLGQPTSVVWSEIWDDIVPMLETALNGTEGTYVEEQLLIMERNGYPEETYYTFSYSPIPADDGTPGGIICANTDDTRRVIGDRQVALLRDLAAATVDARTIDDACAFAMAALANNPRDLPFAMVYLDSGDGLELAGTTAIAPGHPAAPRRIDRDTPGWPALEVHAGHRPRLVGLDGRFPDLPSGPWCNAPRQAAVVPIAASGEQGRSGVLIAGLNPYRLYDEDYAGFLSLAAGQISAAIANAHAYEEERRRAEALAELDRAKTAFFSNVSHEFRTPLTLLMAPLEDALGDPETVAQNRERLDVAWRNARRLMKLVNLLLDFTRIEAGRVQATYRPLDLAKETADLASNFSSAMDKAGLTFRIDAQPLPQPVYVDADMWEKIVLNLISNAFKFTLTGEVSVSVRADDGHAILSVRDTGPGIPAHELPRVFDRFHRIDGVAGRSIEGTGIGLAMVRELVRLHGGEVSADSVEGQGSVFTVRLPFGTAHLPADQVRHEAVKTASSRAVGFVEEAVRWLPDVDGTAEPAAQVAPDLPRIVLADDNSDMRGYIRRLLGGQYRVEAVSDGEAAWQAITSDPPALVLTDVMMPRLDGFGLLKRMRGDPKTRHVPLVMLSARAGDEARVEALNAGVDDYLVKPFNARELMAKIGSQLQLAAVRRQGEAQVLRVLDSMRDCFQVFDRDWRFIYQNGAADAMLRAQGIDVTTLIGRSHWDVFPHAVGTELEHNFTRVMNERVPLEFENYYAPWRRWFSVRAFPVEGGGISVYFQDITERKDAERALRDSETRWRTLTEAMPQLVWLFTESEGQGTNTFMNAQWESYTGRSLAELYDRKWVECVHPDDREAMYAAWRSAMEANTQYEAEFRLRRFDGGYRWFKTRALPQPLGDGRRIWYGTCTDMEDSMEARLEAEAANRAKSEFLANMSHEIRTPLNAIVGLTHIMLHYKTNPESYPKYLQTMKDSADTLMQLINDILDLARIEANRVELEPGPCRLRAVLAECLDIIEVKAREKGLDCALHYGLPDGTVFETDVLRLKQIVMNLLSNAVKFTTSGRIDVEVTAEPAYDGLLPVTIAVRDTGVGIAADKIEHIFGKFTQEDASISRRFGGTGLGLAISRRLSEMLGGRLLVNSEPGRGATFSLRLPLKITAAQNPAGPDSAHPRPEPVRRRILLAEDHEANAMVATTLLAGFGYDCHVVPDGQTAIETWWTGGFDLIMMDVQMPDLDGFEATRQIRVAEAAAGRPRTPILAMTAHALKGDREKCLQAGMDDYISKPFDARELEHKLEALLRVS